MKRLEHALQIAVAHMLQVVLDPERTWWSAIDHGVGKLGVVEASQRKKRGVKPGIPDIIIMYGFANLIGIELKVGKGKLTGPQEDVGAAWAVFGCNVFVARSLEEVQDILIECGVPMRTSMNFLGGGHERVERPAAPRHQRKKRRRKSESRLPVVLA